MSRPPAAFLYLLGSAFLIPATLVLVNGTSVAQGEKPAKTAYKFVFSMGKVETGSIQIGPDTNYTKERGYGFDFGSKVEAGGRDGNFITSNKPFYFSVDVPEGNYDVTVTLGDAEGESNDHRAGRDASARAHRSANGQRTVRDTHLHDERSQLVS